MLVLQITYEIDGIGQGSYIEKDLTVAMQGLEQHLEDALQCENVVGRYAVGIVEMSQSEVDALPEFTGF